MRSLTTTFVTLAMAVCLAGAARAQRTINDCEKIQAADAYNQCLAKFGPPGKTLNVEAARPSDIKSDSAEAAAGAGRARGSVSRAHRGRGPSVARRGRGRGSRVARGSGRKRMTISVGN